MSRSRIIKALVIAVGLAVALVGAYFVNFTSGPSSAVDRYSAFNAEQLTTNWPESEEFPLAVPAEVPAGAEKTDVPGFALENVIVDPKYAPSDRVWLSTYQSDQLGGVGATFKVFQRPGAPGAHPCGAAGSGVPFVQRALEDGASVVVCSADLEPGSVAYDYWSNVPLTTDYNAVPWLQ